MATFVYAGPMESENPKPAPPEQKRNGILTFISDHPLGVLIGFIGAIASIIALPFTIWPILPNRELTYAIQPVRTTLAQSIEHIRITASFQGKEITNDINVAQVMMFNAGRVPIESSDLIKDISLVVSNASILAVSLSVPPKAGTDIILRTNTPSDRITMHWRILEKGDNPVFQIVYAGKRDAPIYFEGRIKEQDSIRQVAWPNKEPLNGWTVLVAPVVLMLLWVCVLGIFREIKPTIYYKVEKRLWFFTIVAMVVVAASMFLIVANKLWTILMQ